jgi:hypothetical protein
MRAAKTPTTTFVAFLPSLVIDHILPFADRSTWKSLILANREMYQASLKLARPWPVGEI